MRERRELLLLNKTLKYLITVPVISVEGNGIGAMFSSFEAFEIASKKEHFWWYRGTNGFCEFSATGQLMYSGLTHAFGGSLGARSGNVIIEGNIGPG